jgi:hypothetical protein
VASSARSKFLIDRNLAIRSDVTGVIVIDNSSLDRISQRRLSLFLSQQRLIGRKAEPFALRLSRLSKLWPAIFIRQKIYRIGLRVKRRLVEMALQKHKRVILSFVEGNHDPIGIATLHAAFEMFFEKNPRVIVDPDVSPFFKHEFGRNLIAGAHGDKLKRRKWLTIWPTNGPKCGAGQSSGTPSSDTHTSANPNRSAASMSSRLRR